MRKILVTLATALLLAPLAASGAAPADLLVVNLKNQQIVHFELAKSPVLSFSGDQLSIVSDQNTGEINYDLSEIKDICFKSNSATDLPTADATFEILDNVVTVSGIACGTTTSVADTAGHIVASASADASGRATLDLRSLPAGIYIICTGHITYKYLKR